MADSRVAALAASFKKQALEEDMPFWLRHSIDQECGGYWTSLERDGTRFGDGRKHLIVQARCIYGFCVAYRLSGRQEYLDQAAQGVAFFRKHFRDAKHGGWVRTTARDGEHLETEKNLYGTAFAMYALAEYARLSHDQDVLQDAVDTFDLVEKHAWDSEYGALYDDMTPDWQILHSTKRADTQMHTMESMSALYAATGDDRYLEMLNRLAETVLGPMGESGFFDVAHDCIQERFSADWRTQVDDMYRDRTIYGHLVEAGWFIQVLAAYTHSDVQAAQGQRLIEHALRYGLDPERGGLYHLGTPRGEVTITNKLWWPQEEMLAMLSFCYRQTGELRYLDLLEEQAAYARREFVDPQHGEWYSTVAADGHILDDRKGSPSKASYHVMQGLYHAYRNLEFARSSPRPAEGPHRWEDFAL